MNTDLLTVARTLAERGWLPGITLETPDCDYEGHTEAVLHLAAIKRVREINGSVNFGLRWVMLRVHDNEGIAMLQEQPAAQGDTLALLRCLRAACEASEGKETTNG